MLKHVGFTVCRMSDALRFWRDGLGLDVILDQVVTEEYFRAITGASAEFCRVVQLQGLGGNARIELFEFSELASPERDAVVVDDVRFAHVCMSCTNIDSLRRRLLAHGGRSGAPPVVVTAGKNRGRRAVYVRDPDGHVLELISADDPPRTVEYT